MGVNYFRELLAPNIRDFSDLEGSKQKFEDLLNPVVDKIINRVKEFRELIRECLNKYNKEEFDIRIKHGFDVTQKYKSKNLEFSL